ncbi:NUDIX hydrolase [Serinicoccus kebangsaanensis]|uniref:NUDIX hydrolase n=1 Tax=Serinicoccus kebangsaanensis TaxID=2602069 RepID=UPI001EE2A655|nr:hypothetical protein [Serinicoccus kebangsaanensis]
MPDLSAELVAVVTAVDADVPVLLTAGEPERLPAGPLRSDHRSMQSGLSAWVEQQTGHRLGYVEQLYTFADSGRDERRAISVSYLGLTRTTDGPGWQDWYAYFPWEDRRAPSGVVPAAAAMVDDLVRPALDAWVAAGTTDERDRRRRRADICFGLGGRHWSPELALQRYELLYESGAIPEAGTGGPTVPGQAMQSDHRRILATALSRLRAKIQYRPVVFELVPDSFTLGQLQRTVEALAGQPLHKQNFRRLVTGQELVEETGSSSSQTGGRPARLYRFRRDVLDERHVAGTKLPSVR